MMCMVYWGSLNTTAWISNELDFGVFLSFYSKLILCQKISMFPNLV